MTIYAVETDFRDNCTALVNFYGGSVRDWPAGWRDWYSQVVVIKDTLSPSDIPSKTEITDLQYLYIMDYLKGYYGRDMLAWPRKIKAKVFTWKVLFKQSTLVQMQLPFSNTGVKK